MPPQKTTKGAKQKKKQEDTKKRELVTKEQDPCLEYAIVLKIYSTERVDVRCYDGKTRQGVISGTMRKKIFVSPGDLVLVAKRDFQDAKCDISLKYFPHEVQALIKMGDIASNFCTLDEQKSGKVDLEDVVAFEQDSGEEEKDEEGISKQTRTYEMPPSSSDEEEEDEETQIKKQQELANQYKKQPQVKDKRQLNFKKEDSDKEDDDVDIDDI